MVDDFSLISFPKFDDKKGVLVPFELNENFPFLVKRVYVITGKVNVKRGCHAHKNEQEVFVCVAGSVKIKLESKKSAPKILILNKKNEGVFVNKMVWHELFDFSDDAIVIAFSSIHFDQNKNEYITDKADILL